MKTNFKSCLLIIAMFLFSVPAKSQDKKTYYSIETTYNNGTAVVYAGNFGVLNLNYNTNDIMFTANLAILKTGNKKVDSLLVEQKVIQFTFEANLGQGLLGLINEVNDNTYHKILGTLMVNNISYQTIAYVRIENVLKDSRKINKTLIDIKLQFEPNKVNIPHLSGYFNNTMLFKINDGIIYQNI